MKDFYEILQVSKDATKDEIKKSFRNLAKKYHPDTNVNDDTLNEKFRLINEAYSVLSDDKSRKEYDEKFFKIKSNPKDSKGKKNINKNNGDIKDAMENLNSKFEEFFGFNGNTSEVKEDFLKKGSKNPMDTSDVFNSFFKPKKK